MSDGLPGIPTSGKPTPPPIDVSATPMDGSAAVACLHYFVGMMCRIARKAAPEAFEGELRALRIWVQSAPTRVVPHIGCFTPGQLAAMQRLLQTVEDALEVKYIRPVRPGQTDGSDA